MKAKLSNPKLLGYGALIITMFIWGTFTLMARVGTSGVLQPYDQGFLRITTGGLLCLPYFIYKGYWRNLGNPKYWLIGLVGGLGYSVIAFYGFKYSPVAHAPMWQYAAIPIMAALLNLWVFKIALSRDAKLSLLVLLSGIVCMALAMVYSGRWSLTIGNAFMLLAALCWSVHTICIGQWQLPAIESTVSSIVIALLVYAPIYLLFIDSNLALAPPLEVAMYAVFQGFFAVIVAMITYLYAIERTSMLTTTIWLSMAPIIASFVAVPLLGEHITLESWIGLLFAFVAASRPWLWLGKNPT